MIKNILEANENINPNTRDMEVLHTHFPQCFNSEGKFDIDKFQALIKDNVDIAHEGYGLEFLGKSYAKLLASTDTTTIIQPDLEHNSLPENVNSENIYISGDNLDGLKHLLKSYTGKVKCIYIDPPYNTGSDGFVYNDNFNYSVEDLTTKLSISESQAEKILDLTKRGSASHSAWLMFMAARLQLAKDLLTPNGVIFISIDNNEYANLKLLCDSIFGEENFIEMFSWVKTSTPPSLSVKSRKTNEYILCYERVRSDYKYQGDLLEGGDQPLLNTGNTVRELTFPKEIVYFSSADMQGEISSYSSERVSLVNNLTITDGYSDVDIKLSGEFKWSEDFLKQEIESGTTFIIKSKLLSIRFIRQGEGWKRPTNYIKSEIITPIINKTENSVETNEGASDELLDLMGTKVFSFPKPTSLIQYLANFIIKPNDIIVDFFSGSATTADAIMQYNAKYNHGLKYIVMQLPEDLDKSLSKADAQSKIVIQNGIDFLDNLNKPHFLDEIGMERIKRAAKKIKDETGADIDYGFKHYTLVEPTDDSVDKMEEFDAKAMFLPEQNILEEFGAETVLETWLVKDGYGFGAKAEKITLDTYSAYHLNKHLYMIDREFSEEAMVALMDRYAQSPSFNPENIVIFGYSFKYSDTEMLKKNIASIGKKINIDIRY